MMRICKFLFPVIVLLLHGCAPETKREIRIAVSPWIGYSPLYYADAQGWLTQEGFRIIAATSLYETVHFFEAGLIDGFVSTQYEASLIKDGAIVHCMSLDRSNGGDVLLSNRTLENLKSGEWITAYMEVDSINTMVYNDFLRKHHLGPENISIENKEQSAIKSMTPSDRTVQLIVTYEPYATQLRHRGFQEVGSTKELDILVLDSLYVDAAMFKRSPERFEVLEDLITKAHQALENDPQSYFESVNPYLQYANYEKFSVALQSIEWLVGQPQERIDTMIASHRLMSVKQVH